METNVKVYPTLPILVVDDDLYSLQVCELQLKGRGITNILCCQSGKEALTVLVSQRIALMILDLHMPEMSGEDVLAVVSRQYPEIPVIITTAIDEVRTVVRCMKAGAFDYIVKPVEATRLVTTVTRAIEFQELRQENARLKERFLDTNLKHPELFAPIITQNPHMFSIFRYIESIAVTSHPVLITGETGVGKELITRAIHQLSNRKGDFIAINVAGLDDTTFSDTLFGHKRGAFTGADRSRVGLIEKAANGTLFLDEIGDLAPTSQVKLLRLLQEREYYALGADVPSSTNARILVATNRDLLTLQETGTFREDLYYRLLLHRIHIPPLRERRDDIPLLVDFFLHQAAEDLNRPVPTPPPELLALFSVYDFPGNIRELRAMVFDAMSRNESEKLSLHSFQELIHQEPNVETSVPPEATLSIHTLLGLLESLPTLKETENLLIQEALKRTEGNRTLAADLLGITRQTLHRRIPGKK